MKVDIVIGTRPEAIKLAPVVRALEKFPQLDGRVILTGQHTDLLAHFIEELEIPVYRSLSLEAKRQTGNTLGQINSVLHDLWQEDPTHFVIVQGDTTSAMTAGLTAFYMRIPVGHVEAGLRTYRLDAPFPEELNRQVIGRLSSLNFAPTKEALDHLYDEKVPGENHLTENTIVDAVNWIQDKLPSRKQMERPYILVTCHRRESIDYGIESVCKAVNELTKKMDVVFVTHPNPEVKQRVEQHLNIGERLHLIPPQKYQDMALWVRDADLLITDSGGLQEEAPSYGTGVVVTREATERMELIHHKMGILAGLDHKRILGAVDQLQQTKLEAKNIFGDGFAGFRIAEIIKHYLLP